MTKAPLSTAQARAAWSPPCSGNSATVRLWTGVAITVDPRIVPAVGALDESLRRYGYRPRAGVCGAYVCRRITGGTGYSLHAYKIAIDINWDRNPYSASNRTVTDMPLAMVNEICALRTNSGAPVWGSGRFYRSIKDPMHFEIVCTPADLASGIAGAVAKPLTKAQKAALFAAAAVRARGHRYLHPGSTGKAVADVQRILGIPVTGSYGAGTTRAVEAFQTFFKIKTNPRTRGRVGYSTWCWLIYSVLVKGRR